LHDSDRPPGYRHAGIVLDRTGGRIVSYADDVPHRLSELEERTRQAWGLYRENLSDLDGVAYDHAERAEWGHLQTELRAIAAERAEVKRAAPPAAAEEPRAA
jgi:hypothetical protein